jgi:hypothetical protein
LLVDYYRETCDAIDRCIEDEALAPHEVKSMKLALNMMIGQINNHESPDQSIADAVCMFVLAKLFAVDRGVYVLTKDKQRRFGYVVEVNGIDRMGNAEIATFQRIQQKKKAQKFGVKLLTEDGRDGEIVSVEATQLRMVPIRDKRHMKYSAMNEDVPIRVDPDDFVFGCDSIPDDVSWEYLEGNEWKRYARGLSCRIESLYSCGSPHYLYTPGNPHTSGQYIHEAAMGNVVGRVNYSFFHDTSTRQIIFEVSKHGVWQSGPHDRTDNFTERDFFTGMKRRVRRVGGVPRAYSPVDYRMKVRESMMFESGFVDWEDKRKKCEMCGKTDGPFTSTECCGATVCDTEGLYQINSYERDGQCARNHRLQSICGFHDAEGHGGDWKSCKKCEEFFNPYDYAVKATSQAVSLTQRKYNFDDNVRTDIHPADVPFPTCHACDALVNTTEESTRTLGMRKSFSGGKVTCSKCGGGFGKVTMS